MLFVLALMRGALFPYVFSDFVFLFALSSHFYLNFLCGNSLRPGMKVDSSMGGLAFVTVRHLWSLSVLY